MHFAPFVWPNMSVLCSLDGYGDILRQGRLVTSPLLKSRLVCSECNHGMECLSGAGLAATGKQTLKQ